MNKRCQERVYSGRSFGGHQCQRSGKLLEGGGWFCIQHAPSKVRERRAAAMAELSRKYDERRAAEERNSAQRREAARRAGMFDELLAALQLADHWVAEYISQMSAYTISDEARKDRKTISAVIAKAAGATS